tara:strand:- start:6 stop:326 length:321 start_codon:yes stop_codon:yes gene_type:complete
MKLTKKDLRKAIYEELGEVVDKKAIQGNIQTQAIRKTNVGSMSPTEVQAMETLQALEKLISQPGNQMSGQMLTLLTRVKDAVAKITQQNAPATPVAEHNFKRKGNK